MNKILITLLMGVSISVLWVSANAEVQSNTNQWKPLIHPPKMSMNKFVSEDNFAFTVNQGIPYLFVSVDANMPQQGDAFIQLGQWFSVDNKKGLIRINSILSMIDATDKEEAPWKKAGFNPEVYPAYLAGSIPYIAMKDHQPYLLYNRSLFSSNKNKDWFTIDDPVLNGKNSYSFSQTPAKDMKKILISALNKDSQFNANSFSSVPDSEQLTDAMVGNMHFISSYHNQLYILVEKQQLPAKNNYLVVYRLRNGLKPQLERVGAKIPFNKKDNLDGPYTDGIYFNHNQVCTLVGYQYQPSDPNLSAANQWHIKKYCYSMNNANKVFKIFNSWKVQTFKKQVPASMISHIKLVEDQRGDNYNYQLEKYINHHWLKQGNVLHFKYVEEKYFYVDHQNNAYLLVITQPSLGEDVLNNNMRKFHIYKYANG